MTATAAAPGPGPQAPDDQATPGHGPGMVISEISVDVEYLAWQYPSPRDEWLRITEAASHFAATVLPAGGRRARDGDVVVRLTTTPQQEPGPAGICAGVWAVICGSLIPVAAWDGLAPGSWADPIRATAMFTMDVLLELDDRGADLGAGQHIDLDQAVAAATAGIPAAVSRDAGTSGEQQEH
jgi:hypothetical protein